MAKLNRRNTIIVLAALVAATGAIAASGAFTTVSAERTVDIQTAGDSAALLQLAGNSTTLVTTDANDLIRINESTLNRNATTEAEFAIDVTNNGDNAVGFYVDDSNIGSILDFQAGGTETTIVGSANAITIASGGSASIDLVIDLTGTNVATDIPGNVTFVADANAV